MGKRLIAGLSMSVCAIAYAVSSLNKPTQLIAETNSKPTQYQSLVSATADQYLKLAQTRIEQPTSQCYQRELNDCLDILAPTQPQLINSRQPEKAIAVQAKLVSYQIRLDAITLAKAKSNQVKLPGMSI